MNQKLLPFLLVAAVVLAYVGVFAGEGLEFVYDDIRFIADNDAIQDLGNAKAFFTDPKAVDPHGWGGIYRPLRTLEFALDWNLTAGWSTKGKVVWFHLRNILYHAVAVLLLWLLFRRWGAGETASVLGALVFALHPVQVEAVAWITSRADVLYLVLFLGALWLHGRSVGLDSRFIGSAALLTLALLAKESAVVFVGAAFLTDFFFRDGRRLRTTLKRWPKYLVYAALAVVYVLLWRYLHAQFDERWWHLPLRWGGSFVGTLLTMARGFVYYMRLVLFPVDMAQDWYLGGIYSPDPLTILCAVLILALFGTALVRAFRGGGWFSFAVLWFFIAIFPASNLYAPIGIVTAERFLYLPMVGVSVAVGILLARFWRHGPYPRVGVAVLLVCLGMVSFERAGIWTTHEALWLTTLDRFESPRGLDWLAQRDRVRGEKAVRRQRALADADRTAEAKRMAVVAKELFEESIRNYDRQLAIWYTIPDPRGPVAVTRAHRSLSLCGLGRYQEALDVADLVLADWPDQYRGHSARALALYGLGRFREASREIERALVLRETESDHRNAAAIYEKLAMVYGQAGNKPQAFIALQKSWEHLPNEKESPAVYRSWKEAEQNFKELKAPDERQVDRNPQDWPAWLRLANLYASYGFYAEAGQIYHKLLGSEEPTGGDPIVLYPYARLYWQTRDTEQGYQRAADIYEMILQMVPDHPEAETDRETCLKELERIEAGKRGR